jgi:hypothetical protein
MVVPNVTCPDTNVYERCRARMVTVLLALWHLGAHHRQ